MTYHEERFPDDYGIEAEGSVSVFVDGQEYLYYPLGWVVSTNTINVFSATLAQNLSKEQVKAELQRMLHARDHRYWQGLLISAGIKLKYGVLAPLPDGDSMAIRCQEDYEKYMALIGGK